MKKKVLSILLVGAVAMFTGCMAVGNNENSDNAEKNENPTEEEVISGTFDIHVQGDDWGCAVDKIIIDTNQELSDISDCSFSVDETKLTMNYQNFQMEEGTSQRTINDVYLSDELGNKIEGDSNYITIEMAISPMEAGPYVSNYEKFGLNEWSNAYSLEINVASSDKKFNIEGKYNNVYTSADEFEISDFEASDGTKYKYAQYIPNNDTDTLVVWLHGIGEGGTDTKSVLLNAEVVTLAGDDFQNIMGGAYILAPQCPTYWMDADGNGGNYVDGAIQADGTSAYTESLHELIDTYKNEIGAKKVIIVGCSNGGYMTMRLAMDYGDEYTAYVPICEAMEDSFITNEDINRLKNLSMFFIYAKNDPLVTPEVYEIPTLERLQAAGAEDLCVFCPEDVHDTTGRFTDENGEPYQYFGHGSWQYFFNNEAVCDYDGISCWEWMAQH